MRVWLVYIRKSVVRDDTDLESPERQLYICQTRLTLTENQPYTTEIYQDLDRSGTTEAGRPDWLRLKEQLNRPEVAGVIASSLDRLYRNVSEFLTFLNDLERSDKVLITAKESLDTSGPLGRFVVTILMALFEMESRLTSARMVDMIEHKRRRQGRHWGVAPFGCDRDDSGQLVPSQRAYTLDDEVRYYYDGLVECYRLYATNSYSYEQVADMLNLNGWQFYDRDFVPIDWNEDRVRGVVNRWRMYRGELALGNPLKNHNVEWLAGGHKPILPIELCDAIRIALSERNNRKRYPVGGNRQVYILSSLVYCHECGMMLTGQTHRRRHYRHKLARGKCQQAWLDAETVEAEVMDAISELLHHPTLFSDIRCLPSQVNYHHSPYELQDGIAEVRRQLTRLEDLYVTEGAIAKASYMGRRQELMTQLTELEAQEVEQDNDFIGVAERMLAGMSHLEDANPETKRALVSEMIQRLEVRDGKVVAMTPQPEVKPFFALCSRWAGWESNPHEG